MKKLIQISILIIFTLSCTYEEDPGPDQDAWEYALPGSKDLSNQALFELDNQISNREFESITGLIVIKDDHLIFENYYRGSSRDSLVSLGQASLIFTWAAIGREIERGTITISSKISEFLPEYDHVFDADERKRDITIENIFLNRSGIAWNEGILRIFMEPNNDLNRMKRSSDWLKYILEQPMEAAPGQREVLNTATGIILGKILENISSQPYDEYLDQHIMKPLGIRNFQVETDSVGNFNAGNGISLTLMDFTRFGYLILNEGLWKKRRVIDPNFISASLTPNFESNGVEKGYVWEFYDQVYFNEKVVFVQDEFGQHLYIVPELDMVVAISAENYLSVSNNSFSVFLRVFQSQLPND